MVGRRGSGTVAIVGAGSVGATTAFAMAQRGLASEILLVDVDEERAAGEAMDVNHGAYFTPPVRVRTGDHEDCHDADVVVLTAGAAQEPGESRLDLAGRNAALFGDLVPRVTAGLSDDAVLLVVTNLVDVLSYVAWAASDLPAERVVGSGTVLDTSRLRHVLSRRFDVDPGNVHGYVVGEHGDTSVVVWSAASVSGVPLERYAASHGGFDAADRAAVEERVRGAAAEIIERKGATYYAIALATAEIVEAVLRDERSVLTVSTLLDGAYGVEDVYASAPCVVGGEGVREVLEFDLADAEREGLRESARVLRERRESVGW
jgi:L-lactate dehydrogenase